MRFYDEIIYVNAKGQCSHLLGLMKGEKKRRKRIRRGRKRREKGGGVGEETVESDGPDSLPLAGCVA